MSLTGGQYTTERLNRDDTHPEPEDMGQHHTPQNLNMNHSFLEFSISYF